MQPKSDASLNLNIRRSRTADAGHFAREPFRIFFPAAVLAGLIGVALWPLYFTGVTPFYPGVGHARIMADGLFGGFIFGFLGTAMPRMLSARPLEAFEVFPLVLVHAIMVASFALEKPLTGDILFLLLLAGFLFCIGRRAGQRKDLPPPGFVLVGMALLCAAAGAVLGIFLHFAEEPDLSVIALQKLLSYQGFVLLPILGIGPFIFPRLFGTESLQNFPESFSPPVGWLKKALVAFAVGVLVISSFFCEARGWIRTAFGIRFSTTLIYLIFEVRFRRFSSPNTLAVCLRLALLGVLAGFLAALFFPFHRVALLHLTLVGGFAVITFIVATRVIFGHSGNIERLKRRNGWLLGAVSLMWLGMATRISADFWPKIMVSHYIIGALTWIAGLLLWAAFVLPKVLIVDPED